MNKHSLPMNKFMGKVAIVIPNWNGAAKLRQHLPDVLAAANGMEVIVVDDGSTDESVKVLKSEFGQIKLIEKKVNTGFSSTVNLGVAAATAADFVLLLNSDASPRQGFLQFLLPHFQDPKVFSVGCSTGGSFARATFKDGFFWHSQAQKKVEKAHKTLWVSGGSGIFRKSIWDELGGLDSLYDPFYEEDLDLGYRAMKRGFVNIFEPKSLVEHYREKGVIAANFSKGFVDRIAQRNQLIFIWKNITSPELFSRHKKAVVKMLIKNPKYWLIFLSALVRINQIIKRRHVEQRQAKLTDEEILDIFRD